MKQPSSVGGGLEKYRAKRDFRKTAEPKPRSPKARKHQARAGLRFVIQKHAARRLHYDFRIEMEGTLKSWAVPKGIPTRKGDKRLAVHVEDHPIQYADFEGTIPEGNYGAGTVMVWDKGTYSVSGDDPLKSLEEGKIHLTLRGRKLKGEWTLVRTRRQSGDKEEWLFMKTGADHEPIPSQKDDRSVLTRRSMKGIAAENKAQWTSAGPADSQKRPVSRPAPKEFSRRLKDLPSGKPAFVEPMKARLGEKIPRGKEWLFEIKFDGVRALAIKEGESIQLCSRTHKDVTRKFPEVAEALRQLPCRSAVVDGEIVALEASGRSSFQLLQVAQMPGQRPPICCYLFDLLHLEGRDLRSMPLQQRKEILETLLQDQQDTLRFSASLSGDPSALMAQVRRLGLEGLIAKKSDSKYEAGRRSGAWLKLKSLHSQEFVIGGYTPPKGSRQAFGAILVGCYEEGKLMFASKVGTGFDARLLKSLYERFQRLKRADCPFVNLPEKRARWGQGLTASEMKRCTWLEPKLVCQVRFSEWTRDGHLRHPAFLGLREDKRPKEAVKIQNEK